MWLFLWVKESSVSLSWRHQRQTVRQSSWEEALKTLVALYDSGLSLRRKRSMRRHTLGLPCPFQRQRSVSEGGSSMGSLPNIRTDGERWKWLFAVRLVEQRILAWLKILWHLVQEKRCLLRETDRVVVGGISWLCVDDDVWEEWPRISSNSFWEFFRIP